MTSASYDEVAARGRAALEEPVMPVGEEAAPEQLDGVDLVNHPPHYTSHPSGVECIAITEWLNFCVGNAVKYLWRAGLKGKSPLDDLRKARWYVDREIARLEASP